MAIRGGNPAGKPKTLKESLMHTPISAYLIMALLLRAHRGYRFLPEGVVYCHFVDICIPATVSWSIQKCSARHIMQVILRKIQENAPVF